MSITTMPPKRMLPFRLAACLAALLGSGSAIADPAGTGATATHAATRPPNVVFLLVDDMGWKDTGFTGSDYFRTPRIDALAAEGMTFTNAYSAAPNCAPSRGALLSGMSPVLTGIYTVGNSDRGKAKNRRLIPYPNKEDLEAKVVTLAESLKAAGYATATIGKYHVGHLDTPTAPENQGFDINIAGSQAGGTRTYFSPYKNPRLKDGPPGEYLTDRLTREAIKYLGEHRQGKPFFLYMPYFAVHTPIQPRPDLLAKTKQWPGGIYNHQPSYGAMVASVDESVGQILDALDRLGLAKNTLVVFTSDNGGLGGITAVNPLRGGKGMVYEGGIRVPLSVRWPHHVRPGSHADLPVILPDFYPTLVKAAGGSLPPNQPMEGVSLLPVLEGHPERMPAHRPLFWHVPVYLEGNQRIGAKWRATPASVIRDGPWKLIEQYEDNTVELYNLDYDLGEAQEMSKARPDVTRRLLDELHAWQTSIGAPTHFKLNPLYAGPPGGHAGGTPAGAVFKDADDKGGD